MQVARVLVLASALCLLFTQAALAGAPLKGIDVKLGKNPGGGCAARVSGPDHCAAALATNDAGQVDYGVLPKGDYTMSVSPPSGTVDVTVSGAVGGPIERDVAAGETISFQLDGATPLVVTVARVKSHNNINNN
jgi:hypothetical protein